MEHKNQKFFTYLGTIKEIGAKQKVNFTKEDGSEGFFMKQKITVNCAVGEGEWLKIMPFSFDVNAKKMKEIEGYSTGEEVYVDFFISAKNGFVSLNLSKISRSESNQTRPEQSAGKSSGAKNDYATDPDVQDLPF